MPHYTPVFWRGLHRIDAREGSELLEILGLNTRFTADKRQARKMIRDVRRALHGYQHMVAILDRRPRPANVVVGLLPVIQAAAEFLDQVPIDYPENERALMLDSPEVREAATTLMCELARLNFASKRELLLRSGWTVDEARRALHLVRRYAIAATSGKPQAAANRKTTTEIVCRFLIAAGHAALVLRDDESRGRGRRTALRNTIVALARIYDRYAQKDQFRSLLGSYQLSATQRQRRGDTGLREWRLKIDFISRALCGAGISVPKGEELARLIPR